LLIGKPAFDGEKFSFLELGNKKIVRVNIIANIVDRYNVEGERKYIFLTVDDGSGQIKLKAFGDDSDKLKNVNQGDTVAVIGTLRHFKDETYIFPEIIKSQDPKYLLVRKLELEKERKQTSNVSTPIQKQEIMAVKDQLLDIIKKSEDDGGVEADKIMMELRGTSPDIINQEIKKLLEEGIIFEPRPGKIRWLG
jgi:RPA family protein